jgi:hypothetical protein
MGSINVRVSDISGSRISEVEAPDDVPVNRILVVLIERMNLPLNSPDGQLMSYKLHHRRTGQQLLDNQTLAQAAVTAGDELRLQPEITAGGGIWGAATRRRFLTGRHVCQFPSAVMPGQSKSEHSRRKPGGRG